MDRNLALELTRVTEAAALEAARWMGKGDGPSAVNSAIDAICKAFQSISFNGKIILGQTENQKTGRLHPGETVGDGSDPEVDLAVKPLECIDSVAAGRSNALAVIAAGPSGSLMTVPDIYMEKIAVSSEAAEAIDLNKSLEDNVKNVADAKKYSIEDITVAVLDRERHEEIIDRLRHLGCRLHLIPDGDISAAIAAALPGTGVDMLVGIGGAKEGIISAVAIKCIGGGMQAKMLKQKKDDCQSDVNLSNINIEKVYSIDDLAAGDNLMFAATGVTDGDILNGVRYRSDGATTNSLVLRSQSRTRRFLVTEHYFDNKPLY